jgi:hypothetical protein
LFSVAKVGSKPFTDFTFNSIVIKFFDEDTVVNSIECFLEVDEDATSNFALVEGVSNLFRYID